MKVNMYNQRRCREAVKYEIWMLVETYKRYKALKEDADSTTDSINATSLATESSLVPVIHTMQQPSYQAQDTQIEENVYLESFLLHLRNLIEFLYSEEEKYSTDIIARRFYESQIKYCQSIGAKPPMFSKAFINRLHKKLAHLSSFRVIEPEEEKGWNIKEIYNVIMPSIKKFNRDQLLFVNKEL